MLHAPYDGLVETAAGPVFVRVRGSGPPCLAFHGGPGFDHVPLIKGLEAILAHRTVVFFDQLGCGATPAATAPVTAEATFAHTACVLDALADEPAGLIAHSWGTVAAAAALALRPGFRFSEALIVNPIAVDSEGYAAARTAIAARLPDAVTQRVWQMLAEGADGADAFALLLPYYVADAATPLPRIGLAAPVYVSVDASLGTFDYTASLARFGPVAIIRGDGDYVEPATFQPLLDRAEKDIVIARTGHYPFFEDAHAFAAAVASVYAPRRP